MNKINLFLTPYSPNYQTAEESALLPALGILVGDRAPMVRFHQDTHGRTFTIGIGISPLGLDSDWEIRKCGFDFSQVKEETEFPHAERTLTTRGEF